MANPKIPIKKAVSFVIKNKKGDILLIKRPSDDVDLPDVWGLPAGTVKRGENWRKAVIRAGKEKLGVDLKVNNVINEGRLNRKTYILYLRLFDVSIISNQKPKVPQPFSNVTQYTACKWTTFKKAISHLQETAPKGSLCCTLYLVSKNIVGKKHVKTWGVDKIREK